MILVFALPCETIFFSSHIEEKTNMHGLWLRNIITIFFKNLIYFLLIFALSWVMVYKFWSKQSNFQIFKKQSIIFKSHTFWSFSWAVVHAFWSKIIKFGKLLIFGRGSQSTIFGHFHITVHFFWPKIIKFGIFQ